MAKATKICKVCGAEYEYCHTVRQVPGVFRWQDVACCPEHGSIYLARIAESRSSVPSSAKSLPDDIASNESEVADDTDEEYDDDIEDDDDFDEEDFDDDTEEIETED